MTSNHLLLYCLAELMLEHEQHVLPVDLIFDDDHVGDFVKSIQIDSPYQQMLLEGVLTESVRDEKLFVTFTVEGYFHFVLGDVIFDQSEGKEYTYLIELLRRNRLNGVKEGVEQCLIQEVNQGKLERLVSLIDAGGVAEQVARFPLVHAFMKNRVEDVFNVLMENPSVHDWNVIKHVRGILSGNQKQQVVDQLDGIIKESEQLRQTINELLESKNEIEFTEALTLISFYSDLNALDQAKQYYTKFIEEAEKRNDQNSLVVALEQLGDSEYKRSGHDGYKAAMAALTRAAEIREAKPTPQKEKLKNIYRLLGFAYLSLGLQVVKSTAYFEKAKAIMLEETSDSAELAEINLYIGLVNFWRGLRGVGRWGHADPSLLEGLDVDLFEYADAQFQQAYNYHFKHLGKTHPQTFKAIHYLQENRYALGNYEKAIPWLKKYTEFLPFKTKAHTDNFYRYCLVVSLEEYAKQLALTEPDNALVLIQEAFKYIQNYDEGDEIATRLTNVNKQIEAGKIEVPVYQTMDELPPLESETHYKGIWSKWQFSEELKGFQTNNWMVAANGVWFFNGEKKQLVFWDKEINSLSTFNPTDWPEGCGRIVFDQKNRIFYSWSSIRSTVYELTDAAGSWNRLSFGVHDVHACGASYAFDPINNRLFEFGGYGYFTYKNWLWVYDISEKKWIQLKENKPGISPYPRNGQLLPIENGTKAILISGIGSDTGIQREHQVRLGLASATDVGYFTWLRDAHELDFATMEWRTVMSSNHNTIRHEGSMGYIADSNLVVNWGGTIPSPEFGTEAFNCEQCSCAVLSENTAFKNLEFKGEYPPSSGGYFQMIPGLRALLFIHQDGIWKFELNDG
jgi:tetratricopeptide (TPR) repeat protein